MAEITDSIDWGDIATSVQSSDEIFKSALDVEPAPSSDTTDSSQVAAAATSTEHVVESKPAQHLSAAPLKHFHKKQLDKLSRHVPPSLDLHYITPQLVGMAPPKCKYTQEEPSSPGSSSQMHVSTLRPKKRHENDPAELSSFLERRHPKRYLLFNVSDEDVDDRSLLLLGRQVVHLPWGSPRFTSQQSGVNSLERQNSQECPSSPNPLKSPGSNNIAEQTNNKSSQTPAVSRVMEICYAIHAYLTTSSIKGKRSPIACVYCSNGKTRTGVVAACYLRFANKVPDALSGFELFCERRGITPGIQDNMSGSLPPSLRQFFKNFDAVVNLKRYPHPQPLLLKSVQLQGVPVDDMPCIDIWEHGDVARHQVYSSHDDVTLNEWDDDEGSYGIGQILNRDFTLVCRFGGRFAQDADDPTKVLFRYVNSTKFLKDGELELGMESVDMMRRYADSFDEEDFLLTFEFESIDDDETFAQRARMSIAPGLRLDALKIGDRVLEGMDSILHGWRVISESHLSHFSFVAEDELKLDLSAFTMDCLGSYLDFRRIALQLTNGDADSAREELTHGLFGTFFTPRIEAAVADELVITNFRDTTNENALYVDDIDDIPEQQKSCDEESYFTANDDEIQEDSSIDRSIEQSSLDDGNRPPPQSRSNEEETPFSHPELIMIESNDAVEEEKTYYEPEITSADESTHNESDYHHRDAMSPVNNAEENGISEPNTPFADRSRSSLLDALKLRELGKSMASVGINDTRSSLLKEISESARKRNQHIEGYEEYTQPLSLPNITVEKYSKPRSDAGSLFISASSDSSVGEVDCESIASDGAVISPVSGSDLPDATISNDLSPIDIQQPILDDAELATEEVKEEKKAKELQPLSSLAAAAAKLTLENRAPDNLADEEHTIYLSSPHETLLDQGTSEVDAAVPEDVIVNETIIVEYEEKVANCDANQTIGTSLSVDIEKTAASTQDIESEPILAILDATESVNTANNEISSDTEASTIYSKAAQPGLSDVPAHHDSLTLPDACPQKRSEQKSESNQQSPSKQARSSLAIAASLVRLAPDRQDGISLMRPADQLQINELDTGQPSMPEEEVTGEILSNCDIFPASIADVEDDAVQLDPEAVHNAMRAKPNSELDGEGDGNDNADNQSQAEFNTQSTEHGQPPVELTKPPKNDTSKRDEEEPQLDPTASLNTMFLQINNTDNEMPESPMRDKNSSCADEKEGKEDNRPDPKAALNAMFAKRNAPAVEDQPLQAEEDDDDQPDPKAALNA
ncbi:hypothetical protein ACHAXN_001244, partial [Cyclotella atomus]